MSSIRQADPTPGSTMIPTAGLGIGADPAGIHGAGRGSGPVADGGDDGMGSIAEFMATYASLDQDRRRQLIDYSHRLLERRRAR